MSMWIPVPGSEPAQVGAPNAFSEFAKQGGADYCGFPEETVLMKS
jgi:hypothetical protein